jgi:hypothetical protein
MTFLNLLTVLFIGLKLANYIAWSWWIVFLPLYFIPAIMFLPVILAIILLNIALIILKILNKIKIFQKTK